MTAHREPVRVLRIIARMNMGGPAYHVSVLSGRMDRRRYDTLLLTGAPAPNEGSLEVLGERCGAARSRVPGLRPELRPVADARALLSIARCVWRYRPAVVHTHTAKAGLLGRLAATLVPARRPVIVHTYHGHVLTGYFGPLRTRAFRALERGLASKSDCLIGVSSATVDELVALRVAPRDKFRVVPVGLDLEHLLAARRSDGAGFRAEVGAGAGDVLAVFVGRLVPIKRVDRLLDAVAAVRARGVPLRLAVVGDGALRPTLERQGNRLGLGEAVRFLGFRTDLGSIWAGSDLAVLSSANEGTPVALIEAAAAGRPAVATAVGGVADIVNERTGVAVPSGDPAAFARALEDLARDGERRARMGRAAREHIRERFSSRRLVSDITGLYDELLAARTRA